MLATLALAGLVSGAITTETSVTTWLVFDPHSANRLTIEEPPELGGPTGTRLVGGVRATLTFDATKLLLHLPLTVAVRIDEIRIAGDSFAPVPVLPDLQTGTLCVVADPTQPGTGAVVVPLLGLPQIAADMRTLAFATSPLVGALFPDGIALTARIEEPLGIDLRAFLLNLTAGPIAVDADAEGVIPPDVALLGGQGFAIQAKILNALGPPRDPLLDECAAFLAGR